MSEQKIYVANGKKVNGQYGEFRNIALCLSNIPKEHIYEFQGKKYVNLTINDKKEPDQYGKDVNAVINTYKPDSNQQTQLQQQPVSNGVTDDLPF